jgi:hypothetical protein
LFKIDGGIKVFHDKQKIKNMTINPPLQKMLKGILHTEDENKHNHKRTGSNKPHEKDREVLRVALIQLHTVKSLNNKNN